MLEIDSICEGKIDSKPKEVGYDEETLTRLDRHYSDLIGKGAIQGASYLISRKGKVFAHRSLGKLRPAEESGDLLPDSIRKTYSITKAFTAVAIAQLIDRGLLFLAQSAGSVLPELNTDKHKEITIFHLLTHTSGLRGDPGFYTEPFGLPWFEWMASEHKKHDSESNWIKTILAGPLQNMPGKEWIYSTSAYALLGGIIAKVSGKSYEQYIHDEILQPLGMENSFFKVPEIFRDKVCVTNDWAENQIYSPKDRDLDAPPLAGNGLYSTLEDLWKFGQMMLNSGEWNGKRILSTRAAKLQTSNHLQGIAHQGWGNNHNNYEYGLGWSLEHYDLCSKGTFSHEGFGHCGLYVDPVEELVFVFFVPSEKGYMPESVLTPRAIVWSGIR